MKLYRSQGVVLRTTKLGEADRIITLCTEEHGKVRAVAKGVRKSGSRFGARLEPLAEVQLQLSRGRNLDIVTQVETVASHHELREHLGALGHASCMAEAVDIVMHDREPQPQVYFLLTRALTALAGDPRPVVAAAFLWKLLALEGFEPLLLECARCGNAGIDRRGFSPGEGGAICENCISVTGWRVEPGTFEALEAVLGGRVASALRESSAAVGAELERFALATFEYHFERRLRSSALLL